MFTLALFGAALGWVWLCAIFQAPAWAYLGAAVVALHHVFVLFVEFTVLWFVHPGDDTPRATARMLLVAWLKECTLSPRIFYWRQPFLSHRCPDTLGDARAGTSTRHAVVFVHGFGCNRAAWLPLLERARTEGIPYIAVNLEPMFGSIDEYPPLIDEAVSAAARATGRPPVVVAHSMGGVAVRAWLRSGADVSRVTRVITLGSPHRGTHMARFGSGVNAWEMRLASPWLRALAATEDTSAHQRFTCFYSNCDNIVMPCSSATLAGAHNRHLPGLAHMELMFEQSVWTEVRRWCQADVGTSSAGNVDRRR